MKWSPSKVITTTEKTEKKNQINLCDVKTVQRQVIKSTNACSFTWLPLQHCCKGEKELIGRAVLLMAVEFIILFNQADVQVFFWHFLELRKHSLVFLRGAVLLNYGTIWPYKSRKIWWLRIWINLIWKNIIMEWNDQW